MVFIMDQLSVGRDIQRQKNHKNPLLHIHAGGRGRRAVRLCACLRTYCVLWPGRGPMRPLCLLEDVLCAVRVTKAPKGQIIIGRKSEV